jgi:hypothetical protein
VKRTAWSQGLSVTVDGTGVVPLAGGSGAAASRSGGADRWDDGGLVSPRLRPCS